MNEIVLEGCRPVPLADYLKALGVLRLVSEQRDSSARASFSRERFVLHTEMDRTAIERFFLEQYEPTAIVAPWNGGSGFYPSTSDEALQLISSSATQRYTKLRETIEVAHGLLRRLDIGQRIAKEEKHRLLEACRAWFPDHALPWLDAAFLLSEAGAKYPPLLGTGGNDGRLDFSNNYMQRLIELIEPSSGEPLGAAPSLLRAALFDEPAQGLIKAPIGQFLPSNAGGANAGIGFDSSAVINPWDFILMLEGAVAFAATAARQLEHDAHGGVGFPFTVRTVGVGYGSASNAEESSSRAEIWVPVWNNPASYREVHALLCEGRARIGTRPARNAVDFARAIVGLGVDRGIQSFQRYGFHVRNGLSYFAVPVGRFEVRAEPQVTLLDEVDQWIQEFGRRARASNAPASAGRALRQLETSILDLCARSDAHRVQGVLIALGACERVMATSSRWTSEAYLRPVPLLSPEWILAADDGSVEFRLALSLASVVGRYGGGERGGSDSQLREQIEPVSVRKAHRGFAPFWDFDAAHQVVATSGHLADCLNGVLKRRLVMARQVGAACYPDYGRVPSDLGDVTDFVDREIDDGRLIDLLWGCILLDWSRVDRDHRPARRDAASAPMGAFYSLLKLCYAGPSAGLPDLAIPVDARVHRAAAAGDGGMAARLAVRRLRASGFASAVESICVGRVAAIRTAAALLFPVGDRDRSRLMGTVLRTENQQSTLEGMEPEHEGGAV